MAESLCLLLQHSDLVLQLCRDLGIVINWEKSDLHPSTHVQYLDMLIDTSLEKVFPSEARLSQFQEVATSFLALPSPPARMWQQLLGHMASLEHFLPRGRLRMRPLQWRLKDFWSIEKWQSLGITVRRTNILLTRMRIGHTHATHSYLMKSGEERRAPLCNSCRVGLTIEHILTACPAFDSERRAASLHGRSMSEVLGNDCRIGGLMLFLRNTGFYHKF